MDMKKRKIKAIFFDIDNTLYDSSLQVESARRNAIKAMIGAGLKTDEKNAKRELKRIVKEHGSNYPSHFNRLLQRIGQGEDYKIIAAGVVAYHNTKLAYLRPFPDTISTLLQLREEGYKLGVITDGKPIKQWEKLIRMGLEDFFHVVIISGNSGREKPSPEIFREALKKLNCQGEEALMVGDKLKKDILGANKVGMTTVQILKGKYQKEKPKRKEEKPDYIIHNLNELPKILKKDKKREIYSSG